MKTAKKNFKTVSKVTKKNIMDQSTVRVKPTRKTKGVEEITVKQALKQINKGQRMLHHSGRVLHAYYLAKFADQNKVIEVKMINA